MATAHTSSKLSNKGSLLLIFCHFRIQIVNEAQALKVSIAGLKMSADDCKVAGITEPWNATIE